MTVMERVSRAAPASSGVRARRRWQSRYVQGAIAVDLTAGAIGGVTAYLVRFGGASGGYLTLSLVLPLVWVAAIAASGGYDSRIIGLGSEEFARVFHAFVAVTATVGFVSFAAKAEVARGYVVLALPIA